MKHERSSVYVPPIWLHNRAIIRRKRGGREYVLRRLRLEESAERSTVELVPMVAVFSGGAIAKHQPLGRKSDAWFDNAVVPVVRLSTVIDKYEPTGRTMSVLHAPL